MSTVAPRLTITVEISQLADVAIGLAPRFHAAFRLTPDLLRALIHLNRFPDNAVDSTSLVINGRAVDDWVLSNDGSGPVIDVKWLDRA